MRRKFIGENCDKNEIVDAENNLKHHQCYQTYPGIGVGNPVHGPIHDVSAPIKSKRRGNRKNAACVSSSNRRNTERREEIANGVSKLRAF